MERSNPRSVYRSGRSLVVGLPTDVREAMGLTKGDRVIFEYDDDSVEMHKATIGVASETSEDGA
jgi:bifunctional DNA-binding transcriptional regulator/antitoxin component of YhaV-PrlF toxin-antitoxin module